jgi:hypothetical protein
MDSSCKGRIHFPRRIAVFIVELIDLPSWGDYGFVNVAFPSQVGPSLGWSAI